MACELCNLKRETEWLELPQETANFHIVRCRTHHEFMIVANHHGDWEPGEREMVISLANKMFPGKRIRWEQQSIKDHAHCHIEGT
jgi:hypothetical protein